MQQLLLINPRSRVKGKIMQKKPRTAAQRAATRKLVALNRSRSNQIAIKAPSRRTHKAPSARLVARRRRNTIKGYYPNPIRRSSLRRNPAGLAGLRNIGNMAMTALQGAGGALAVNTMLNYVPLPAMLKSGNGKYIARGLGAVALGVFGDKILPGHSAQNMAVGALTVTMHDLLLGLVAQAVPTLKLGDVGDYDTGVSEYLPAVGYDGVSGVTGDYSDVYTQVGEFVS